MFAVAFVAAVMAGCGTGESAQPEPVGTENAANQSQPLIQCANHCDCPIDYFCDTSQGICLTDMFGPQPEFPQCYEDCQCFEMGGLWAWCDKTATVYFGQCRSWY
ncbi:hypothetical protein HPC49_33245 [Pyxidicoccus fallax]|uniref:Uncharacterized protein n=1 Tax=Pyxidicoccus fallax TaxID=394095 RepID=A0A848L7G0_9BACT|nr:hypothetical protein [Pyxidicoccus fallax]NMO14709.1 hypothetical protein [Pyxidicoccus fallax]NPC83074.1 hypothetical protein [Pyxidicoccus fallax]